MYGNTPCQISVCVHQNQMFNKIRQRVEAIYVLFQSSNCEGNEYKR